MKILVAYDGSRHADAAIDQVLSRPWPALSEVRIVTVLEDPFPLEPPYEVEGTGPLVDRIRQERRRAARQRLLEVMDRVTSVAGLPASTELREGNTKTELLSAIEEWRPDLVVVGSHGRTGLTRMFMGSVSHALIMNAHCSVEVVKLPPD